MNKDTEDIEDIDALLGSLKGDEGDAFDSVGETSKGDSAMSKASVDERGGVDDDLQRKAAAYDDLERLLRENPQETIKVLSTIVGVDLSGGDKSDGFSLSELTPERRASDDMDQDDEILKIKKLEMELAGLKSVVEGLKDVPKMVSGIAKKAEMDAVVRKSRVDIKTTYGVDVPEAEIERLMLKHGVPNGLQAYQLETYDTANTSVKRQHAAPNERPLAGKVVDLDKVKSPVSANEILELLEKGADIKLPPTLADKYGTNVVKK